MNNDDERDYDEEKFNQRLMETGDGETDPEDETWVQYYDPATGVPVNPPADLPGGRAATRSGHRTTALRLAGMAERSDPEFVPGLGFSALTHAVLALSAPASPEPDSAWRQRAVEAEAELWAIGQNEHSAPDGTWRQRAVEAEAALTAIGGILCNPGRGSGPPRKR